MSIAADGTREGRSFLENHARPGYNKSIEGIVHEREVFMDVSWNLYRLFYYVACYGSTAAASKELLVAQPSVSMGIKQLEKQLGCVLFVRSRNGMELTEHGRVLYDHISQAHRAIRNAEDYLNNIREAHRSMVSIAVIDTTLQFVLTPFLNTFREAHPDVEIKLYHCTTLRDAENLLEARAVDFAVMHDCSLREGMENIPIREITDIFVCAARFRDRLPQGPLPVQKLKDYPVIAYFRGMPSRTILDRYLQDNGVDLTLAHEFSHASSVIRQIQDQFSLAFLLENSVQHELSQGQLVQIPLDPPPPCRYYYLIKPAGRQSVLSRELLGLLTGNDSVI